MCSFSYFVHKLRVRVEINCFLKLYVLNKDAIFPETVEFSEKIRSQVLQLVSETNCTCGFHLITWKRYFSAFFVLIFE